jgi:hypothetical protein
MERRKMISNQVRHRIYCEMWRAVEFTGMNVQCVCARVWTSQSHTTSRTLMYSFILLLWRCDSYRRRHVNEAEVEFIGHFNSALFCKDQSL